MNIKFNKLFKAAFLFFVIFVMIFNSFAAISVSDGSAFVTKAEFSADLNNLSNRMSALENSIDAKIDSLVSSYLSRNGIWNGEKQTINYTTRKFAVKTSGTRYNGYVMGIATTAGNQFNVVTSSVPQITFSGTAEPTKDDFVASITKSGLCVLQYSLLSSSTDRIRVTLKNTDGNIAAYLMNAWLVYTRGVEIYETIGSTTSLKTTDLLTIPVSVPGTFIVPNQLNRYLYFFVSKGSSLKCANIFYANTTNAAVTWDYTDTNKTLAESYPSFISCMVY